MPSSLGCLRIALVSATCLLGGSAVFADDVVRSETRQSARVSEPIEIALITTPSTGYDWRIDDEASSGLGQVTLEEVGTSPPPCQDGQPLVGAPVIRTWLLIPDRAGPVRLVLVYGREGSNEPPVKAHTYRITVAD